MVAGPKKQRHHRTMDAIVRNVAIMDGASALDWRVLHAIEIHQGYKDWKCRLSLDRIAKVARCSKRAASRSSRWWRIMGAIAIRRTGKFNTFEILQELSPVPEKVHGQRQLSRKKQKRDSGGRFAPSTDIKSSPSAAIPRSRSAADRTRGLLQEVHNYIPPPPPTGGDGPEAPHPTAASEPTSPRMLISYESIKKLVDEKGPDFVINYMREHDYAVPECLLKLAKSRQEGR